MDQKQRLLISRALMGNQNARKRKTAPSAESATGAARSTTGAVVNRAWSFTIPGPPIPKGRPRHNTITGSTYTPERTKQAEQVTGVEFRRQVVGYGKPRSGEFRISCVFHVKRDDADIDNLLKMVMDGLQGVAYINDKQVKSIGYLRIVLDRSEPHTEVLVEEMT